VGNGDQRVMNAASRAAGFYGLSVQLRLRHIGIPGERDKLVLAYLAAILMAEVVTAAVNATFGLGLHAAILLTLLWSGARARSEADRNLWFCLTLAPLIRLCSLSLPLSSFPRAYWYAVAIAPVLLATLVAARTLGYTRRAVGLTLPWPDVVTQIFLLVPLGIILGYVEYLIIQPQALARSLSLGNVWQPALVLFLATGFGEEIVFRGLLQHAAIRALGPVAGILAITVLFTALHIGYLSISDALFAFMVGLFLALLARWTRSIAGPTVLHGCINLSLFLLTPLWLAPALSR